MKVSKEILILALPLLAAGCGGSSTGTSPPPPPPSVDAEGIFEGTAGNGDSFFGIIAHDGTAAFLEYPDAASVPPVASQGAIVVPAAVLPDANGAFTSAFTVAENNGFVFPSGDVLAASFSGTANTTQGTLSGSFLTKNSAPVIFTTQYDATNFEKAASIANVAGTYSASFNIGATQDTATVIIASDGSVSVSETAFSCNYSGHVTVPNAARNAYEIDFGNETSADICADPHGIIGKMEGLGALFSSSTDLFAITYNKSSGLGIYINLSRPG